MVRMSSWHSLNARLSARDFNSLKNLYSRMEPYIRVIVYYRLNALLF